MKNKLICIMLFLFLLIPGITGTIQADSEKINVRLTQNNDSIDLVIITINEFESYVTPLLNHKNNLGIRTIITTVDEIYQDYPGRDEAEQIKYYIKDAVEQFGITYVLFIGGAAQIPPRFTHIYFDEPFDYPTPTQWVFPSDFYFADIYNEEGEFSSWDSNENNVFAEYHWDGNTDEFDLTPDVYIGRLACINEIQVETVVNKIITYETMRSWAQEWFTNIVYIAGDGIPFDPENVDESEYLQEFIIEIMDGFIPIRIWASNGQLNNAMNINNAIEDGAGFVFFNGHGLHNTWATYLHNSNRMVPPGGYNIEQILLLQNNDMLPIIISDACYHLQYDDYPNCFGWSFISNPNGGGIAFIGGSDTDLAYGGTRIVEKGIERLCLRMSTLYQEGVLRLGELWGEGLIRYQPEEGDLVDLLTIVQNHLFGDPTLQISDTSEAPMIPNPPTGPISGNIDIEYFYNCSTIDPNLDSIYYLFEWGDDSIGEWLGPYESGESCQASHIWAEQGSFEIRVKAKDENGIQSDWSDPLQISMPRQKINMNDWIHLILQYIFNILRI